MKKFIYLFIITILLSSCKAIEKRIEKKSTETKQSIEITVSCGEKNNLEQYMNEGWKITKEYSEEKICSWKSVAASKDCNIEKDKGCKIIKPDKIGEEKVYLLEK